MGLLGGGKNLGLGTLEGEQLPSSMGKMPAFTLAKEAVQDM